MRKNKKIITICASVSFAKEMLVVEKELKKLGFQVKIPKTAKMMKRNNNFDVSFYKTWYKNKNDYKKKRIFMEDHFKKVIAADAILIVNHLKNNIPGYIGGNTLMEMTIAFHYKKPIFIYNPISEELNIKEEIYGLSPIFINQDLSLIAKNKK